MRRLFYLIIVVKILCSCSGKGVNSYCEWYSEQQALKIPFKEGELVIKEITPEMMYIQSSNRDKISVSQWDSFKKNCGIRQVLFELKFNDSNNHKNQTVYGKHVECVVDKRDALDLIYEHAGPGNKGKRIVAVFDSKEFDSGKLIEFAHPQIEKVINIKVDQIRINHKRSLIL